MYFVFKLLPLHSQLRKTTLITQLKLNEQLNNIGKDQQLLTKFIDNLDQQINNLLAKLAKQLDQKIDKLSAQESLHQLYFYQKLKNNSQDLLTEL